MAFVTNPMPRAVQFWIALCSLLLVSFKPIIDFFWETKLKLGHLAVNLQGFAALILLGLTILLLIMHRTSLISKKIPTWAQFLFWVLSVLAIYHILVVPRSLEWTLKYWTAASGLLFIPWASSVLLERASYDPKPYYWISKSIGISLSLVFIGMLLQLFGLKDWATLDTFQNLGNVGRLTSFYYHPLDLVRVLIWVAALLTILLLAPSKNQTRSQAILLWSSFFFLNFLLLRTTHRTTLIFCLFLPLILGLLNKKIPKGILMTFVVILSWNVWGFLPSGRGFSVGIFELNHFIDFGTTAPDSSQIGSPSTGVAPIKKEFEFEFGRGRSKIWHEHWEWMKTFTPLEWALGAREEWPRDSQFLQTHNQVIDLVETFGLVGLFVLGSLLTLTLISSSASLSFKVPIALVYFFYAMISQPLVSPTFVWWSLVFLTFPSWKTAPADWGCKS